MATGEIHGTSAAIGELTAEVRNLNGQCSALFRKFDDHVKEDQQLYGVVKQLIASTENLRDSILSLKIEVDKTKASVNDLDRLKHRVFGACVTVGLLSGGGAAVIAKVLGG